MYDSHYGEAAGCQLAIFKTRSDCLEEVESGEIAAEDIRKAYVAYCRDNGFVAAKEEGFTRKMSEGHRLASIMWLPGTEQQGANCHCKYRNSSDTGFMARLHGTFTVR